MESLLRVRCLGLLGGLAAMVALASCGGDSTPESTSTVVTSTTTTPSPTTTTTTTASSTTTAPSETTEAAADFDLAVDVDTEWGEVFDALNASEQECVRDAFEGDRLESVLHRPVMSESDAPEAWEVSMFSCLAPQTARAVFLALSLAGMEEDGLLLMDEDAEACLEEWVAGIDVVATIVALSADDAEAAASVTTAFMRCDPDLLISLILEETGLTIEDLSEEEATCLREWATDPDSTTVAAGSTEANVRPGLSDCAPDLLARHPNPWRWSEVIKKATPIEIGVATPGKLDYQGSDLFAFEATEGELYDLDVTPENYVLAILDAASTPLATRDYSSYAAPFIWHAPATGTYYVRVAALETGPYILTITIPDFVDDHPNSAPNATPVEIGAATQSELDYEGDIDFFTLEATGGEYYELDVTLGTLQLAILNLFDTAILNPYPAESTLPIARYDYSGESTASRLMWRAPATGSYYVVIGGFANRTGTYTLTIVLSDIEDDHPNSTTNATPVEIGLATQGELEYQSDIDYFTFEATEGQQYELDVTLGTLDYSGLDLYDADGNWLTGYSDYGESASRLIWHAPATGDYHAGVSSLGTGTGAGTYTVTIAISDIGDDHPNSTTNATPVEIEVAAHGELDYEGDTDYFAFEAEEGESYQLDVTLGTLEDSVLNIFDADGTWLDGNDNFAESRASRLVWNAPGTGTYYVEVTSFYGDTGTYTLTIATAR